MLINIYSNAETFWINSTFLEKSTIANEYEYDMRTVWSIVLLLNLAIFIITKFGLLKLTLTVRSILKNPHDTLFFVEETEKLIVTPICTGLNVYDLVTGNGPPFSEKIPNCGVRIVFQLLPNILFFGGLALALMKLIAIRYVKIITRWGEINIMMSILTSWQVLVISNTYLMAVSANVNGCYGEILYLPGPIYMFACVTELAIYISICQYVYKSDVAISRFISAENCRRRKRRNAFNLYGHIVHFLIELIMMILIRSIWQTLKIPPKICYEFTSTMLSISMLLFSKPVKTMCMNKGSQH